MHSELQVKMHHLSWFLAAETIVANYRTVDEAQNKMRELDKKIWKGRRMNAKMNDPPSRPAFEPFSTLSPNPSNSSTVLLDQELTKNFISLSGVITSGL
jgi:hypothetical protein